jgi:hypothetical protein
MGLLLACGPEEAPEDCTPPDFSYPLDDSLAFQDLQAKGSHNSYHIASTEGGIPEWDYTHAPLGIQLATQGVRQLELDLHYDAGLDVLRVIHVPLLDPGTTCETFTDCLEEIAAFSRANPAHHPLLVLLEFKLPYDEEASGIWLELAENVLQSVLGEELMLLPDRVQGDHPDLKTAIETDGWPSMGQLRGKTLFVLHDTGELRSDYTQGNTTTVGRLMFPDAGGNPSLPISAVHAVNDPFGSADDIQALVLANHLVRTRADSGLEEARAEDNSRLLAALDSGAHFISTDFPVPTEGFDYWVQIPEGTPSRCNPLSAPGNCASEDIEDPGLMGPCD